MELTAAQNSIISLIGVIATMCVAFGFFGHATEQIIIAAAGTLVSISFSLWAELHRSTKVKAAALLGDQTQLKKLSGIS